MVSTWYSARLGDAIIACAPLNRIEEVFMSLHAMDGSPVDMAVFTRQVMEGDLHCEVTAYFSPAAAHVALLLGAEPCPRPPRKGTDLLVGDQRCWSMLFPEDE